MKTKINYKDACCGLFFICLGMSVCLYTGARLSIGSFNQMGPGFFPLLIGGLLVIVGLLIGWNSLGGSPESFGSVSWRGVIFITVAPIVFGATIEGLGLIAAIALTTLAATFASSITGVKRTLLLTIGMTAFCVAVFYYLGLPAQLIGSWLTFGAA